MSKRKILMERKIRQAKDKGHDPSVVIPRNCKNKHLLDLIKKS